MIFKDGLRLIAIMIVTLLICINPLFGKSYSTISLDKLTADIMQSRNPVMANYSLYNTKPVSVPTRDESLKQNDKAPYKLVQSVNTTQTLQDTKGKTWWTRELVNRPEDYYCKEEIGTYHVITTSERMNNNEASDDYYRYHSPRINQHGTLAIRSNDDHCWELIDSTGKEVFLPPKTGLLNCAGCLNNTYWLFWEANDPLDEGIEEGEYERAHSPFQDNLFTEYYFQPDDQHYFTNGNGFCLFQEDGTLYKQFTLPDSLALHKVYFNPRLTTVLYTYTNIKARTQGVIYSTIDNQILSHLPNVPMGIALWDLKCTYTSGGSYIVLQDASYQSYTCLLNQQTGEFITQIPSADVDFSSAATGYVAFTYNNYKYSNEWLVIYDLKNHKPIYAKNFQANDNPQNVHISLDGKECSVILTDYKTAKRQYYHLVQ